MLAEIESDISSSRETLMPMAIFDQVPDASKRENVNAPTVTTPTACAASSFKPPPKNRPLPVAVPVILSCGEKADGQRAEDAVDQVNGERADRIVELELVEHEDGEDDQHAGDHADDRRRADAHEGAGRGDRHQTGEAAVEDHARSSGFLWSSQAVDGRADDGRRGGDVGGHAMCAMALPSAAMVEPGLNPNQPNHRTKTPRVAVAHVVAEIGST